MEEIDDDEIIRGEASFARTGIALIVIFTAILLMLVFLFREELGIGTPQVSIAVPDAVPSEAQSVADRAVPAPQ